MKRIIKVVVFGVCLGLLLVIIQQTLQIDRDTFLRYYWIIALIALLGAVLCNVIYNITYQQRMKQLINLLDNNPKEYIDKVSKLLQTAKGERLRNILKINLAAGYIETKQYDTSINIMENLSEKQLGNAAIKMVWRLNLCLAYFYAKQFDKAMLIYQESQPLFSQYQNDQNYGGNIAALDILATLCSEDYQKAETMLSAAKERWQSPRLQENFNKIDFFIKEIIQERQG